MFEVSERVESYLDFEGTLKEVKEYIEEYIEKYGEDAEVWEERDMYDSSSSYAIYQKREETEEEKKARLEKEKRDEETTLRWKRKQLERLKKELGED